MTLTNVAYISSYIHHSLPEQHKEAEELRNLLTSTSPRQDFPAESYHMDASLEEFAPNTLQHGGNAHPLSFAPSVQRMFLSNGSAPVSKTTTYVYQDMYPSNDSDHMVNMAPANRTPPVTDTNEIANEFVGVRYHDLNKTGSFRSNVKPTRGPSPVQDTARRASVDRSLTSQRGPSPVQDTVMLASFSGSIDTSRHVKDVSFRHRCDTQEANDSDNNNSAAFFGYKDVYQGTNHGGCTPRRGVPGSQKYHGRDHSVFENPLSASRNSDSGKIRLNPKYCKGYVPITYSSDSGRLSRYPRDEDAGNSWLNLLQCCASRERVRMCVYGAD
jgi:hypothetical protein